jgi:hypothetical protein
VHAAAGRVDTGRVAFGWRGLWLAFLTSASPAIVFTVTGLLGLRQGGTVSAVGLRLGLGAGGGARLVIFTPLTTVIWILARAGTLPRSWETANGSSGANRSLEPDVA